MALMTSVKSSAGAGGAVAADIIAATPKAPAAAATPISVAARDLLLSMGGSNLSKVGTPACLDCAVREAPRMGRFPYLFRISQGGHRRFSAGSRHRSATAQGRTTSQGRR